MIDDFVKPKSSLKKTNKRIKKVASDSGGLDTNRNKNISRKFRIVIGILFVFIVLGLIGAIFNNLHNDSGQNLASSSSNNATSIPLQPLAKLTYSDANLVSKTFTDMNLFTTSISASTIDDNTLNSELNAINDDITNLKSINLNQYSDTVTSNFNNLLIDINGAYLAYKTAESGNAIGLDVSSYVGQGINFYNSAIPLYNNIR